MQGRHGGTATGRGHGGSGAGPEEGPETGPVAAVSAVAVAVLSLLEEQDHDYVNMTLCNLREISQSGDGLFLAARQPSLRN